MEMEIWERGVLKHQKMTSPATSYSPALYTHKQHSLCFYLNLPNGLRSSPPYIYFMSFMGSGKKLLIVGYLQKEKTYVRIYSAALQSWRELLLKQSNTALFEKDLELLVIANATVFSQTEPSFSLYTRTMHAIPA